MKHFLLFSSFMISSIFMMAQPVIDASWVPNVGDQWAFDLGSDTPDEPTISGPNVTWDYSSISSAGNFITFDFITPASTPYADSFPNSTIVAENDVFGNTSYGYYASTPTSFEYLGSAADAGGSLIYTILDDPQSFNYIGLNYGNSATDDYRIRTVSTFLNQLSYGRTSYDYIGYGDLVLSTGTFSNTVLIYQVDVTTDTLMLPFSSNVNLDTTRTYAWVAPGEFFPVCQWQESHSYAQTIMNGMVVSEEIVDQSTVFGFNSAYSSTNTVENSTNDLNVYPTLCTDHINVSSDQNQAVEIFDLNGKLIRTITSIQGKEKVDISGFNAGRYFVRQGSALQHFIKIE